VAEVSVSTVQREGGTVRICFEFRA